MSHIDAQPIPNDDKEAALAAIMAYKKQNPTKYAQKKEALFRQYGLDVADEVVEQPDDADKELQAIAKKVTKKTTKKDAK